MSGPKMLLGDFHMHTHFSKDSLTKPDKLLETAIKVGLTCVAVTDHNTTEGGFEVQRLAKQRNAPIIVIVAEEVKTSMGEVTGLFLKERVPKMMSPMDTIKAIHDQGGLVSLPHPYDKIRREPLKAAAIEEVIRHIDIVEVFNARTTFMSDVIKAKELAQKYKLPAGAGSDAHTAWELGKVFVEFPTFDGTAREFKLALMHSKGMRCTRSPFLVHAFSRYAKWRKKVLSPLYKGRYN